MDYKHPSILFTAHLETIYPSLFRKVKDLIYERERIATPDDDFLDLDWVKRDAKKLVIISHGLEGSTDSTYMKGMAKLFSENEYDVLTWNFRGCSDLINKQLRFYHSGATDDLQVVIDHVKNNYSEINLIGFSLGGNLTLKYLGEEKRSLINRAVVFSVPLDLHTSCIKISEPSNFIYSRRFLKNLKAKVKAKAKQRPNELNVENLNEIKTLQEFDDRYTAPLHGYENALNYYKKCSAINFIDSINTPTLIVNAANDPFLSKECYPVEQLKNHTSVILEVPKRGGHVGFATFKNDNVYWSEKRALNFISLKK